MKGYLKIHIAVNVKTKKILSMTVTDAYVHDNKVLHVNWRKYSKIGQHGINILNIHISIKFFNYVIV